MPTRGAQSTEMAGHRWVDFYLDRGRTSTPGQYPALCKTLLNGELHPVRGWIPHVVVCSSQKYWSNRPHWGGAASGRVSLDLGTAASISRNLAKARARAREDRCAVHNSCVKTAMQCTAQRHRGTDWLLKPVTTPAAPAVCSKYQQLPVGTGAMRQCRRE